MKKYNIGLDIGTTSVGWAIVDQEKFTIIRKGNKKLWGVRLFEEAQPASKRRENRSLRRRYDRRRERIKLVREQFSNEINKVDSNFFKKLNESFYNEQDSKKTIKITKKELDDICNYNKKYPTIYHLRYDLVTKTEKMDIRLVYLAIHHIIKYRGNFLYPGKFNINNLNMSEQLKEIFDDFNNNSDVEIVNIDDIPLDKIAETLLIESKNDKKQQLKELLESFLPRNTSSELIKLLLGAKASVSKLLNIESDEIEKISISFDDKYDENYANLLNLIGDRAEIINEIKELYDNIFLKRFFKNSETKYLSAIMKNKYDEHRADLKLLKLILNNNRKEYNKIFRNKEEKCLYEKYLNNSLSYDEFIKEIRKSFEIVINESDNIEELNEYIEKIEAKIENDEFLPKITSVNNGIYPYQLNEDELIKIIENQGKYYPFLLEKTKDDVYKLVKILEFKIPYYVGPLNNTTTNKNIKNVNSWAIRKKDKVKITPYNFEEIIDLEQSAELFINRMISKCTYLLDEPAMANNSILYSKYKVMNELKQIKINGRKIPLDIQKRIYDELFLKYSGTITDTVFKRYLYQTNEYQMYGSDINIEGYSSDNQFANNMQSYVDFFGDNGFFVGTKYTIDDAEEIIKWIAIFEDKDMLEKKIRGKYTLSDATIKKMLNKKYKGWGSLSEKLLTTKYYLDKSCNLKKSIMDLMEETPYNFMQIISSKEYNFQQMIDEHNEVDISKKINYELVDNLATSPATKRGIYQALKIVEELIDYMGYNPENIVIEMARGDSEKQRTLDRKKYIQKLYENNQNDIEEYVTLNQELNSFDKLDLKLFLYFIQEGRSLYSRKKLEIDRLDEYEIDHIIPRTLIKNDSIDNKALVLREENQDKAASFVLPSKYRTKENIIWWEQLKRKKLISAKKFSNLIREKYSDSDIEGFINRQLVETRQITKHVANILKNYYSSSNVIYLHASLSHDYRGKFELFKYRDLNDYHHAHDAYLAAVIGEYKEKYLKKNISFDRIKEINKESYDNKKYNELSYGYVINSLDSNYNIFDDNTGELIFENKKFNDTIEKTLYSNDILISKKTEIKTGAFYQETKNPHDKIGKNDVPLKKNLDMNLYGSYTEVYPSYLCLIKYGSKQKIIGIPIIIAEQSKKDISKIDKYIRKELKLSENDNYEILIDKIPFQQLIDYKGHLVYITGSSCELVSAVQLHIPSTLARKWKYLLNYIFNTVKIPMDEKNNPIISSDELNKQIDELIEFLISKMKKYYPLYGEYAVKFEKYFKDNSLEYETKIQFVREIFKMLNGRNANLKNITNGYLKDRVGRLTKKTIESGTLYYTSTAGIRSYKYEF